jgi:hypothetical protein
MCRTQALSGEANHRSLAQSSGSFSANGCSSYGFPRGGTAIQLPNVYWAPLTTLMITQSSLGAALTVSWQRFVGTALGAIVGAIVASYFGSQVHPR